MLAHLKLLCTQNIRVFAPGFMDSPSSPPDCAIQWRGHLHFRLKGEERTYLYILPITCFNQFNNTLICADFDLAQQKLQDLSLNNYN